MEIKSFMEYVHQKRVEGKSDKQIATSLGMSLKRLNMMLSGSKVKEEPKVEEKKPEPPVVKVPEKKPEPVKIKNPAIEPEVPEVKEEPDETV